MSAILTFALLCYARRPGGTRDLSADLQRLRYSRLGKLRDPGGESGGFPSLAVRLQVAAQFRKIGPAGKKHTAPGFEPSPAS